MAIPLYAAQAHGGAILSLDDPAVVKDLAAAAGTGGNSYTPYLLTVPFGSVGYGTLRRVVQSVPHEGAVTVTVTPWRDGQETAQTISRTLAVGETEIVTAPLQAQGSAFQVAVTLDTFDAPASLGMVEATVLSRRSIR